MFSLGIRKDSGNVNTIDPNLGNFLDPDPYLRKRKVSQQYFDFMNECEVRFVTEFESSFLSSFSLNTFTLNTWGENHAM